MKNIVLQVSLEPGEGFVVPIGLMHIFNMKPLFTVTDGGVVMPIAFDKGCPPWPLSFAEVLVRASDKDVALLYLQQKLDDLLENLHKLGCDFVVFAVRGEGHAIKISDEEYHAIVQVGIMGAVSRSSPLPELGSHLTIPLTMLAPSAPRGPSEEASSMPPPCACGSTTAALETPPPPPSAPPPTS